MADPHSKSPESETTTVPVCLRRSRDVVMMVLERDDGLSRTMLTTSDIWRSATVRSYDRPVPNVSVLFLFSNFWSQLPFMVHLSLKRITILHDYS